jgi:co-chaperonin GroES (HSP10)
MYNYYAAVQALGHLADPLNPEKNPRYIICEDEVYMFLKYSDLILKKEGDDITPLNGYVLCEPMYDTEKTKILLPEHLRKKVSLQYAKVYKTGSRIKEYIEDAYCRDGNEVREGDTIVFKKFNNISIEWDTHRVLDKELYRIQRRFIEAIIKGNTGDIQKDIQPL